MNRFINLTVVVLIALYNVPAHAQRIFNLHPNQSKVLTNTAPWTLTATCHVQVLNHSKSKIKLNVMKHNCIVNGRNLGQGQGAYMTVGSDTNISVSADSGTEINLINMGTAELKANCSS